MKRPTIADLKHKMFVCSAKDIVLDGETIVLERSAVYSGWAAVESKRASTFVPQGVSVSEPRETTTHVIAMRYRSDIQVSSSAWLYEERRKSAPRLFKITRVVEDCDFFYFHCRLTERGDLITPVAGIERENAGIADAGI